METENRRGNRTSMRGTIYGAWVRGGISVKIKMCRKLKRKYKLSKENITTMKETVKQRMQLKPERMPGYEKQGKFYCQNFYF